MRVVGSEIERKLVTGSHLGVYDERCSGCATGLSWVVGSFGKGCFLGDLLLVLCVFSKEEDVYLSLSSPFYKGRAKLKDLTIVKRQEDLK